MTTRVEQTRAEGAAANLSRRTMGLVERDPQGGLIVRGTTISFTNPGTIADSGNGLGSLIVGDRIEVRGSPANSRVFTLTAAAAGSLTVVPAVVTSEVAGPTIIVRRI
jgi:hypothetical protein